MSMMKTGATFLLGTMCGVFLTRGFERCQRHEQIRGGNWRCPRTRGANEKKPSTDAHPGPQAEQQTVATLGSFMCEGHAAQFRDYE
ncbi:hypothetical protein QQP08_002273 [Theobroma cacao]|nr:hypothetical protein QQP08_002273 [Theobroma cacao]